MEASATPSKLGQLLLLVVSLPYDVLIIVMRGLSMPELARLACAHKAFLTTWQNLQKRNPGQRGYAPPKTDKPFSWHFPGS